VTASPRTSPATTTRTPGPTVFQSSTTVPVRCRCGTHIPPGGVVFGVTAVSLSWEELFQDQVFCSVPCVQAFCLESLEILEPLDTPAAKAVVSDLHEVHRALAEVLASMRGGLGLSVR
jgi:hypothetical protein